MLFARNGSKCEGWTSTIAKTGPLATAMLCIGLLALNKVAAPDELNQHTRSDCIR